MHGTFVGDFQEPRTRLAVERPLELDHSIDAIDFGLAGLAFAAVGGVDLAVPEVHAHSLEGKLLRLGVQAKRHRRAGTKRGAKKIVG